MRHLVVLGQKRVGLEVVIARQGSAGLGSCQFPRHPVGVVVLAVEGEHVAHVFHEALRRVLHLAGLFYLASSGFLLGLFRRRLRNSCACGSRLFGGDRQGCALLLRHLGGGSVFAKIPG